MTGEDEAIREIVVEARTHGRVLVRDTEDRSAPLVIGFHGYGESADRSLAALSRIPGLDDWRLAAIEALHPFYNRRDRTIVASWMTRRLREHAIDDNVEYVLGAVRALLADRAPRSLVLAGFSQGVAMAYRATVALLAEGSPRRPDGLVALAGDVPPDVARQAPELPPILLGRGRDDDWYTREKLERDLNVLDGLGLEVETCVFDGGHLWSRAFLDRAASFLARIAANPSSAVLGSASTNALEPPAR